MKLASSLSFNTSTPKSDQHQITFYYSTAELNKLRSENYRKRLPTQEAVIVKQILLVSTKGNV